MNPVARHNPEFSNVGLHEIRAFDSLLTDSRSIAKDDSEACTLLGSGGGVVSPPIVGVNSSSVSTHADAIVASESPKFNDASLSEASYNESSNLSEAFAHMSDDILQDARSTGEILCKTNNFLFSVSQEDINEWNQLAEVICRNIYLKKLIKSSS